MLMSLIHHNTPHTNCVSLFGPHCSTVITDGVVWAVSLLVCVCLHDLESCKMAEQIEMLFGLWTQVVPRYHVLGGNPDPPQEGAILRGRKERGSPLYSIGNTIHMRRQCGFFVKLLLPLVKSRPYNKPIVMFYDNVLL